MLPDPRFHLSAWTIEQVTAGHKLLHPQALDAGTSNVQASLPGGERHAAVGTEYLQSVATMVSNAAPARHPIAAVAAAADALLLLHGVDFACSHISRWMTYPSTGCQPTLGRLHKAATTAMCYILVGRLLNQVGTPASLQDKLRETLRDEHSFLVQFMLTVWRRCLTPFQAATLHIQVLGRGLRTCVHRG